MSSHKERPYYIYTIDKNHPCKSDWPKVVQEDKEELPTKLDKEGKCPLITGCFLPQDKE